MTKMLGCGGQDVGYSIQQATAGGYVVAGSSNSTDGDVIENHSSKFRDFRAIKLVPGIFVPMRLLSFTGIFENNTTSLKLADNQRNKYQRVYC